MSDDDLDIYDEKLNPEPSVTTIQQKPPKDPVESEQPIPKQEEKHVIAIPIIKFDVTGLNWWDKEDDIKSKILDLNVGNIDKLDLISSPKSGQFTGHFTVTIASEIPVKEILEKLKEIKWEQGESSKPIEIVPVLTKSISKPKESNIKSKYSLVPLLYSSDYPAIPPIFKKYSESELNKKIEKIQSKKKEKSSRNQKSRDRSYKSDYDYYYDYDYSEYERDHRHRRSMSRDRRHDHDRYYDDSDYERDYGRDYGRDHDSKHHHRSDERSRRDRKR